MKNDTNSLDNFSTHLKNILVSAINIADSMAHFEVELVHILVALMQEKGSIAYEILTKLGLDEKKVIDYLTDHITLPTQKDKENIKTLPGLSEQTRKVLEKAMVRAYKESHTYVGTEHLLSGLLEIEDATLCAIFDAYTLKLSDIHTQLDSVMRSMQNFPTVEEAAHMHEQNALPQDLPPLPKFPFSFSTKQKNDDYSALAEFTVNLTDKKVQKNIDPIIGRESQIERMINILCRRNKNNPILIGEPGVGKTAIVEGLAKRILEKDVPDILLDKQILILDLALLVSGTIYRGEFEERMKMVIDEMADNPHYILFIDEIHTLIGAGSGQGTMDAANILKPALARGLIRCIGATTIDEYKKYIEKDPALERRFQKINVPEPTAEQTVHILKGIKKYYEAYHHVQIEDDALELAVELSKRYVHENFLPDKAIDLLDEASAHKRSKRHKTEQEKEKEYLKEKLEIFKTHKKQAIEQEKFDEASKIKEEIQKIEKEIAKKEKQKRNAPKSQVTKDDIAYIVGLKLQIDPTKLLSSRSEECENIRKTLESKIMGQNHVIEQIISTLDGAYMGLRKKQGPLASFLFTGPSGVGKTIMAKTLASELYHENSALIRLDMSEFSEAHGVSKLLGSPAGYIGYNERNHFLDEVGSRPYCIILFDEFDKAHSDVRKLMFQILDEGEITSSTGKKISFRESIIIMTTNIGAQLYQSSGIGFDSQNAEKEFEKAYSNISHKHKEYFDPSLLSRIDQICYFHPLTQINIEQMIMGHLQQITRELPLPSFRIDTDKNTLKELAKQAYSKDLGARNVENTVRTLLAKLLREKLKHPKSKTHYKLKYTHNDYQLF